MRTLYIDIYFLINFTVDFLALYFAALFSKTPTKAVRLSLGATFGGLAACIMVFLPNNILLRFASSLATIIIVAFVSVKKIALIRRVRFFVAFLFFTVIIGGLVYYGFLLLEKYVPNQEIVEPQNRNLLLLSIIILLCIGIIKLFLSFFANAASEKNIRIRIDLSCARLECDAFVDSGNLLRDPIDFTPVMILKAKSAEKILPDGIPRANGDVFSCKYAKCIRLIPFEKNGEKKICVGIRPDCVSVCKKGKWENIKVIIIIDEEGGSFGGYGALMPAAALEGV